MLTFSHLISSCLIIVHQYILFTSSTIDFRQRNIFTNICKRNNSTGMTVDKYVFEEKQTQYGVKTL